MKKYNENLIVVFSGIFLLVSFFYLAYVEDRIHDYDINKDWWIVYFEDPKSDELDFIIENHSNQNTFKYEIYIEKNRIFGGEETIKKGEKKMIPVEASDIDEKKIAVRVFTPNNEKKEVYKIISNQ